MEVPLMMTSDMLKGSGSHTAGPQHKSYRNPSESLATPAPQPTVCCEQHKLLAPGAVGPSLLHIISGIRDFSDVCIGPRPHATED